MSSVVPPKVEELLRAGWSNARIAVECRTARRKVAAARAVLGVAPVQPHRGAGSVEAAFRARVRHLFCGRAVWGGPRNENGVPMVSWRHERVSAYRVAFRIEYGREPVGVVLAVCGIPGCVAGRCLDDKAARVRTRGQLAAVLGLRHTATHCREGHAYAEHGAFRPNGGRYCTKHSRKSQKGEAA